MSSDERDHLDSELYTQELKDFIRESNCIEGILRDPTEYECAALDEFLQQPEIDVHELETYVKRIQPGARLRSSIGMNVRIGNHIPPRGGDELVLQFVQLLRNMTKHNAWATHVAYERLHPFMDGNGRSGRALWLWQQEDFPKKGFLHEFYFQTL